MSEKGKGVWVPEEVFKKWESLRLDSSTWNTLMVIAHQQFRYGGTEAHITLQKIAGRTEYSLSTIKRSVSKLRDQELLVKLGQGRWQLKGLNMVSHPERPERKSKGLTIMNPKMAHDREPFPILLFSLVNKKEDNDDSICPFTDRQMETLNSVYQQATELLCGEDAMQLIVPRSEGSDTPKTYGEWLEEIVKTNDRKEAGRFVGGMLKLLKDERVAGKELK